MKFARKPIRPSGLSADFIVCDELDELSLVRSFIGTKATFVTSGELNESDDSKLGSIALTVFKGDIGEFLEIIMLLQAGLFTRLLTFIPESFIDFIDAILEIEAEMTLEGCEFLGDGVLICLSGDQSSEIPLDGFRQGYRTGIMVGHSTQIDGLQTVQRLRKNLQRYRTLLKLLSTNSIGEVTGSNIVENMPPSATKSEIDNSVELARRIVTLENELSSVKRKYQALAASKLGKITLKYWDMKRKR